MFYGPPDRILAFQPSIDRRAARHGAAWVGGVAVPRIADEIEQTGIGHDIDQFNESTGELPELG